MKTTFFIAFLLCGLLACKNHDTTNKERDTSDKLYDTRSSDKVMNKAIETAKSTLDQFDHALASNNYDTSTFSLKVMFPTPDGFEHIWVRSITVEIGGYAGVVANDPEVTTEVKYGDKIKIDKKNISDWMYSDRGTLRGGYTIRVIRSRMTKEDRTKFDADFPYKMED